MIFKILYLAYYYNFFSKFGLNTQDCDTIISKTCCSRKMIKWTLQLAIKNKQT